MRTSSFPRVINKKLILFDVDNTIAHSGQKISNYIKDIIIQLYNNHYEIGIVGGGSYEKILYQLDNINKIIEIKYIFSESGSLYYHYNHETSEYDLIYKNNIRLHKDYDKINILIKESLSFLSQVDYNISGHFIDLRNGLIYISLIGMNANEEERENFMKIDKIKNYKLNLFHILTQKAIELNINNTISISYGGSVGIAIYPKIWDKVQVLDKINNDLYEQIYYFGDKYEENGNDYQIIHDKRVIGIKVNNVEDTYNFITKNLLS